MEEFVSDPDEYSRPRTYRRKPTETTGMVWTGENTAEVEQWIMNVTGRTRAQVNYGDGEAGGLFIHRWLANRMGVERFARLWVQKSRAWCNIEPGDLVAYEHDGGGFYPVTASALADLYDVIEPCTNTRPANDGD